MKNFNIFTGKIKKKNDLDFNVDLLIAQKISFLDF